MLCPRCASMSIVWSTRWRAGAARLTIFAADTHVIWRERRCKNRRCKHKWGTMELCITDVESRAAELIQTMSETFRHVEETCPE